MQWTAFGLAWSVNLLTGIGLAALGTVMLRRPGRVWVGIRVARTPEEVASIRRANLTTGPPILLLGLADILSGPVALVAGIQPLTLVGFGLAILLVSIVAVATAAVMSK